MGAFNSFITAIPTGRNHIHGSVIKWLMKKIQHRRLFSGVSYFPLFRSPHIQTATKK
uniref:Uncharacterized protein n=1 Tax=Ascaris lumbricoides TaxID=6252 RepID=A0A0M3HLT4_ASCLU